MTTKEKSARKTARSGAAGKRGRRNEATLIDKRLAELADRVRAGHRFEDEWEIFRLQYFPGLRHTTVAGLVGAWSQRQGIKVHFEVRKHPDYDLKMVYIALTPQ